MEGISRDIMVMEGIREFGLERADMLSLNSLGAQLESMQPPACAESWELLTIFLIPHSRSLNFGCSGLGLSTLGGGLQAVLSHVTRLATEHAELVLDAALVLFFSQLSILLKVGGSIGHGQL